MGSARVSEEFASVLTRKRFCERVGIHETTLRRWETMGVVKPSMRPVLGIRTAVFEEEDVLLGRRVAKLLRDNPGKLSLREAARRARARGRR
jgi:DNA-binding transcriptional MerR regulator